MDATQLGAVALCLALAVVVTFLVVGELSLRLPRRMRALPTVGFLAQLVTAALVSAILIAALVLAFDFGAKPRTEQPQLPAPGSGTFDSLDRG